MDASRERVLALLQRHGWNATSFQALEPGFEYWFSAEGDAVVAYVESAGHRVAGGAPICAIEHLADVTRQFTADATAAGRKAVFFGAEERMLAALSAADAPLDWLQIGVQACWDPRDWSERTVASQVRRARRKGVTVREVTAAEFALGSTWREQAETLLSEWLEGHAIAPMQFLVDVELYTFANQRRYFVALRDERLVGLLVVVPVYARAGWFLEDLIVDREAPNGTGESLIDACMAAFEAEQAPYATMGLVALADLSAPRTHPLLTALMRLCYDRLNWLYSFSGLYRFRSKFKPKHWEPIYLVGAQRISVLTVLAVLGAFVGGNPSAFVQQTARKVLGRRYPAWWLVPSTLAGLLVPWIYLLLTCDTQYWFGNDWLGKAWASFDVVIAVAFAALGHAVRHERSWGRALGRVMLGAVLADTWMTAAQALLYNVSHVRSAVDGVLVGAAVLAPMTAAIFLIMLLRFGPVEVAAMRRAGDRVGATK